MLAISAQVEPKAIHYSTHQYVNQVEMMRTVTKYASEISDVSLLRSELKKAIRIAQEGIPGPCFLSIPLTMFQKQCQKEKALSNSLENLKDNRRVDNQENVSVTAFYELLQKHSHPIIIVGHGLYGPMEYERLSELITELGIHFFTTYSAKGKLSSEHPHYLGTISNYTSYLIPDLRRELFAKFDLVVFVGVDMVEGIPTKLFEGKKQPTFCMLNSNIETKTIFPIDQTFSISLESLINEARNRKNLKKMNPEVTDQYRKLIYQNKRKICQDSDAIHPLQIVDSVKEVLDTTDIVISDVGLHKQYFSIFYDVSHPKTFFCSNGLGSMGFGLPAAIAAKKLYPKKNVLLVCGDGGFHMSSSELETAVRYNLSIVILLFCDRSLGLIRHYHKKGFDSGGQAITQYGHIDFCQLAQANGCNGMRLSEIGELPVFLKNATHSEIPTLIEIPMEQDIYE